jgi:basic membrane lipoprotein Med (substrate-binding protein (PBP1-ABC) superfamily)/DNA-binding SARP family transcriptional activator
MLYSSPSGQRMQFRLLGALEAGSGSVTADLGPPKQRALLAILLLHVGEIVSVDRLVDLLWGDDPPRTATHSVQIYVSELRKALEPLAGHRLIHTRPPGYLLDVPEGAIDARRFEGLVREATARLGTGEREAAIKSLRTALELWRGPALSDFSLEEFAQPYLRRLHDMHLDAIETLAAAELDHGDAAGVVPLLEAAVREDPMRERSRELLMLALYRSGRHAEALRTFDNLRQVLDDELGIEPSPPLQRTRDRVLLHDPTLLPVDGGKDPAAATRNPYKGLQAFGEHDARDFFGREILINALLQAVATRGLVALVGPSGSGKSSVVAAGLIPRLRAGALPGSEDWTIATLSPGADPVADLGAIVARLPEGLRVVGDILSAAPGATPVPGGHDPDSSRLVLVLDQFEQLFTATDEARRSEFLSALTAALRTAAGRLIVVLTLRADFYDRPLQQAEFGQAFIAGVLHVLPMDPHELEAAIVEPAEHVGASVEPALLAELVADAVSRPGGLPLLQYALTQLFEQRSGTVLSLADYRALGGLRGVLTRRAEEAFLRLGAEEQHVAMQVFLRLVRLGNGTADSRRRLTVSEIAGLGTNAVLLSEVLTSFARQRLLTFDRDLLTGEATVELAHEALLSEWQRLADWIDRHRSALRRRDALLTAVEEWELAGRNSDYLLAGSRLAEFESLRRDGTLQLTSREQRFLDAGLEQELAASAAKAAQVEDRRRLARSARIRLVALGAVFAAVAGAGLFWGYVAAPPKPVAMMWTSEGLVNVQIAAGFDRGVTDLGLQARKFSWEDIWGAIETARGPAWWEQLAEAEVAEALEAEQQRQLREVATEVGLVLSVDTWVGIVEPVAREFPDVHFLIDQPSDVANITTMRFVDAEAAYLAGVVAARKSETGIIGYLGGFDFEGIWGFQAGYEAGARAVDPNITILSTYISSVDIGEGFDNPEGAREIALDMYGQGADIILHAAGNSGLGLFDAAVEFTETDGRHVWAIGVDTDQYESVTRLVSARTQAEAWRAHILTSVLKGLDAMTYAVLERYAQGTLTSAEWTWGLESGASGLSFNGGYIDDLRAEVEALESAIVAGDILVPCLPDGRRDQATAMGLDDESCRRANP